MCFECERRKCVTHLAALLAVVIAFLPRPSAAQAPLTIGRSGQALTVNGEARFLTFISYFDAMDVGNAELNQDFAYLRAHGIDGVRIFPNWWGDASTRTPSNTTLMNASGGFRNGRLQKLKDIISAAQSNRLLVDVSFASETVRDGSDVLSFEEYKVALVNVTVALAGGYRNAFFDLQNEGNYVGAFACSGGAPSCSPLWVPLTQLRQQLSAVDSSRLLMFSIADQSLPDPTQGQYPYWGDLMDDTGLDVLAFHENRDTDQFWTYSRVRAITRALRRSGDIPKPVYLQEPERWLPTAPQSRLTASAFRQAVNSAKAAGAAAWCFHTEAGFNLDGLSIQPKLAPAEKGFVESFKAELDQVEWGHLRIGSSGLPSFDGNALADYAEVGGTQMYVYVNTGGGFGGPFLSPSFSTGVYTPSQQWRPLIGDFNGDGWADYADFDRQSGAFWIHLNQGYSFSASNWGYGQAAPEFDGLTQLHVADVNGDGRADLLEIDQNEVRYRLNTGSDGNGMNTFAGPVQSTNFVRLPGTEWRIVIADFTGDGRADLAEWSTELGAFWIHANNATGNAVGFSPANWSFGFTMANTSYAVPLDAWTVVVGDFTGDGKADFADYQRSTGTMWVHKNVGPGFGRDGSAFEGANWGYGQSTPSRLQAGRVRASGTTTTP